MNDAQRPRSDLGATPRLCLADDPLFDQHVSPPGHPERPARLGAARQGVADSVFESTLSRLPERDATLEELSGAHSPSYLEDLQAIRGKSGHLDADTFHSPRSFDAARRASGAAVAMTDCLLAGEADFGFSVLRPPGHHARPGSGMGFCLLNHVAVAARHALGRGARRVVILDWDVHHGNGTEEIFGRSAEVLFVSVHQSPQYPGTGAAQDIGFGEGTGYTLNVPLSAGAGNAVYAAAFERLVLPVIEQFSPDLTLVSAGYDAHQRDPLGGMQLDGAGYGWMTSRLLATLRKGPSARLGFLLEGGYDLEAVRESVTHTLNALTTPVAAPTGSVSSRHANEIAVCARNHSEFWSLT